MQFCIAFHSLLGEVMMKIKGNQSYLRVYMKVIN